MTTVVWKALLMAAVAVCVTARCRRFPAIQTFDMDAYMGRWYLQYKYSTEVSLPLSQCWSWTYYKNPNGKLKVQSTYVNSLTNRVSSQQSLVWMKNPTQPSLLRMKLNYFLYNSNEDYQVIGTDYANFTIEYQCSGSNALDQRETVWLSTREQYPHPYTLERAFAALIQLGMNNVDLDRQYQSCQVQEKRRSGASFVDWLTGADRTSRSDRPSFWQWLTGAAHNRRSGAPRPSGPLSGFLAWLGL